MIINFSALLLFCIHLFQLKSKKLKNINEKKKLIKKSNKQKKRLIFDKTKEKENITNKIPYKRRDPYIDCIRILGMYAIIIHHCLLHGKILQKYGRYKQLSLMNTFCHWHVSSFALVSGIVGYKTRNILIYYLFGYVHYFIQLLFIML